MLRNSALIFSLLNGLLMVSCSGSSEPSLGSLSVPPKDRRVFVTSKGFTPGTPYVTDGDTFASTDDADRACVDLARAANLGGTWAAWLSTSKASPVQHVIPSRVSEEAASSLVRNVVNLNGVQVSGALLKIPDPYNPNYPWFGSEQHLGPINYTEKGSLVDTYVWTGVFGATYNYLPGSDKDTCLDWKSGESGYGGSCGSSGSVSAWSDAFYAQPCNVAHPFYCLEVDMCRNDSDCASSTEFCFNRFCEPKTLSVTYTCPNLSGSRTLIGMYDSEHSPIEISLSGQAVGPQNQGIRISFPNSLNSSAVRCLYNDGYLDSATPTLNGYCVLSSPNSLKSVIQCSGGDCSIKCSQDAPWTLCTTSENSFYYCPSGQKCGNGTCI